MADGMNGWLRGEEEEEKERLGGEENSWKKVGVNGRVKSDVVRGVGGVRLFRRAFPDLGG